jgi:hypothetical protein
MQGTAGSFLTSVDRIIVLVSWKCRATFELSVIGEKMLKKTTVVHVALRERSLNPAPGEHALYVNRALPVVLAILLNLLNATL